ncbi:hypothetical protein VOLCADRAFT_89837 [Volvox carteri f. nagariensis]|uniref:Uncharacterized protein n=1 Tax=Volvox carteri f. nagariensis TaxID=3068 RepID=D8TSS6_VOLCA|nr:uncharacterized protein VOLCADRAFT_89837 [Volvox carteri f. nagariensis]EFJ49537.1 hypothetical protein VOLCADRAFT_89837 [Volvox carteri f. nagariensis]|eukprot:XP_002949518.1 hypothetical protein VOLCADRAFT_89837 [Volvox carteri f. nagariensis]
MTTDQPDTNQLSFGLDDTHLGIKLKSQKLLVGPLELGFSACYTLSDSKEAGDKQPLASIERFKPFLIVKDVYFRGKFELEPQSRRLHYSKKFRLPFLNTDLFKLRLTAQLPAPEAAGGVLGRALSLTVAFQPERSYRRSVVRKAPDYALQLSPRLGAPQVVYDTIGFPGSVYLKANTTLHVSDSAAISGLRARLDVHSLNAVIRLYDPATVKPCRVGKNLSCAARSLLREEVEEETPRQMPPVVVVEPAAPPQPDVIDRLSATAREWAHAVLVNSCVATRNLQDKAMLAAERVREYVTGGGSGDISTSSAAAGTGIRVR